MPDNVNHPVHYTAGKIEVFDFICDQLSPEELKGYVKGNVLKYVCRESRKGGIEDLKKARWYLDRLIESEDE